MTLLKDLLNKNRLLVNEKTIKHAAVMDRSNFPGSRVLSGQDTADTSGPVGHSHADRAADSECITESDKSHLNKTGFIAVSPVTASADLNRSQKAPV